MPPPGRSPRRRNSRRSGSRSRSPFHNRQRFRPQSSSPRQRPKGQRSPSPAHRNKGEQRPRRDQESSHLGRQRIKSLGSREHVPPRKSRSPRRQYEDRKYQQHDDRFSTSVQGRYRSPRREGFRDEQEIFQSPDQYISNLSRRDPLPVDMQRRSPGSRVMPHFSEASPYPDKNLVSLNRQTESSQYYSDERMPVGDLPGPSVVRSTRTRSPVSLAGHVIAGDNKPQYSQTSFVSQVSSSTGDQYGMLKVVSASGRKKTLDERFRSNDQIGQMPLKFEDNITIGIHRHPDASSVASGPINRMFDPHSSMILISRRREEGRKAIFDREEIKQFRHDSKFDEFSGYEERRIIAVIPSERRCIEDDRSIFHIKDNYTTTSLTQQQKHEKRRERDVVGEDRQEHRRFDYERSGHKKHKERKDMQSSPWHEQQVRVVAKPDPRYEPLYKEEKEKEERIHFREQERIERVQHDPSDLRHNLLKHRSTEREGPKSVDARRKLDRRHDDDRHTMDHRTRQSENQRMDSSENRRLNSSENRRLNSSENRRLNSSENRRLDSTENRRLDSSASRSSDDPRRERKRSASFTALPDFSRRQDKYNYDVWKDKPELIPRNPSYFEHDNRDDIVDDNNDQFRRGGFRGRPDFRGRYIGRGFRGRVTSNKFRGRGRGFSDFSRSRGGGFRRDLNTFTPSSSSRFGDRERERDRDRDRDGDRDGDRNGDRDRDRDRDGDRDRDRDRDRGRGRGRERERNKDEWKHDMFEEIEKEDDNKPTSTT